MKSKGNPFAENGGWWYFKLIVREVHNAQRLLYDICKEKKTQEQNLIFAR